MLQRRDDEAGATGYGTESATAPRVPSLVVRLAHGSYRVARRIVIAAVGATVVLLGLVMIVTPGPAVVVVPIGLAILAIEFTWARRLLKQVRARIAKARQDYFSRYGGRRGGRS